MKTITRSRWLSLFFVALLGGFACRSKSPEQLDRLITDLQSPDSKTRNSAALEIAGYGATGEKAVGPLIRLLNTDPNNGIKTSAAYALRSIGTKEAKVALDSFEK